VTDLRIAKWKRWCEGTIYNNVLTMDLHRHVWNEAGEIIEGNAELPDSYWWEFMRDTYATTQAVAVRRQADTHPDAASLGKLIQEIEGDSQRITREWWLGLWDLTGPFAELEAARANSGWHTQYGGDMASTPPSAHAS
jgi:hypothetical protein